MTPEAPDRPDATDGDAERSGKEDAFTTAQSEVDGNLGSLREFEGLLRPAGVAAARLSEEAAANGDAKAWGDLVAKVASESWVARFAENRASFEDAQDAVQEAVAYMLGRKDSFEFRGLAPLRSFLRRTILSKLSRAHARWARRVADVDVTLLESREDPEERPPHHEEALAQVRSAKTPHLRVLHLCFLSGLTDLQVAKLDGLEPSSIRSRRLRAYRTLRAQFCDGGAPGPA